MSLVYNTHSYFWRHAEQLNVLPKYLARFEHQREVAVWCAGCAQGEEAYSLAFLFSGLTLDAEITATDILPEALEKAKAGLYPESRLQQLPAVYRQRFRQHGSEYQVPESVARRVTFKLDDLRDSRMSGPFDVVVCRNVLIYFDSAAQTSILTHLCGTLKPRGLLVLGYSESSLLELSGLARVDDHGIFEKSSATVEITGPALDPEVCLLSAALTSYARGCLHQAGDLLEASLEEKPDSPIARYFKAMLELESGHPRAARKDLRWILDFGTPLDPETERFLTGHGLSENRFLLTVNRLLDRLERVG